MAVLNGVPAEAQRREPRVRWGAEEQGSGRSFRRRGKRSQADFATTRPRRIRCLRACSSCCSKDKTAQRRFGKPNWKTAGPAHLGRPHFVCGGKFGRPSVPPHANSKRKLCRGAHCAPAGGQRPPLRRKTDRAHWLGKARRRMETASSAILRKPGPGGPGENANRHSDFARRKFSTRPKG